MADDADRAQVYTEAELDRAIGAARQAGVHMEGAKNCMKCGDPNDRRDEGYGVCSACVDG